MQGVTFYFDFEVMIQVFLQSLINNEIGIKVATIITLFGEEIVLVAIMGLVYWVFDKKFGKFIGLNMCVGLVANPMTKNIFNRRRPYFDNPQIKCLKPVNEGYDIYDIEAQGFSFPSGHSTNSAVMYGCMPTYDKDHKWLRVTAIVAPLLVGLSRVCLGVHYVTDVLCGWLSGILVILLVSYLLKKVQTKWKLYLGILLVSCLGIFYCKTDDYFTALGTMIGFFAGDLFEERFVNFENTRTPWKMIVRVLLGSVLFFGLNTLLKMPFSSEFLHSPTMASYLYRTLRYSISVFVLIGAYPMLFKKI